MAQVEALAVKGVRADIYDPRGRYPLLKACEANHTPVAAFLLEQGGLTYTSGRAWEDAQAIVNLLTAAGAKK